MVLFQNYWYTEYDNRKEYGTSVLHYMQYDHLCVYVQAFTDILWAYQPFRWQTVSLTTSSLTG